jgi:hypothetical protein
MKASQPASQQALGAAAFLPKPDSTLSLYLCLSVSVSLSLSLYKTSIPCHQFAFNQYFLQQ